METSAAMYTNIQRPSNQIISEDTALYCITENSTPWSYVDLTGNKTDLNNTVDDNTGIGTLAITTDQPGYYSCQVTRNGVDEKYTVGIFNFTPYTGNQSFRFALK